MSNLFLETRILIWSEDADRLAEFYKNVLELEYIKKVDIPKKGDLEKDYGHMFQLTKDCKLWIGHHDGIKGQATAPNNFRIMHNLFVEDVFRWYEIIKKTNCQIIQDPIKTPFSTEDNISYVCTWLDPDGNCWQFMTMA